METLWKKYSYVIILIVLSLFIGSYFILSLESDSNNYQEIVVTDGQSLWELAHIYSKEHSMKPQDFIDWVSTKNNLTSSNIKSGEKLVIPIKVKKQLEDDRQLAFDLEKK